MTEHEKYIEHQMEAAAHDAARLRQEAKENPPRVERITYLIEDKPGHYRVGCRDEPQTLDRHYVGPCADVYADDLEDFFYVCTDDYEGNAMLNIETLPKLIEALQRLQAHLSREKWP